MWVRLPHEPAVGMSRGAAEFSVRISPTLRVAVTIMTKVITKKKTCHINVDARDI